MMPVMKPAGGGYSLQIWTMRFVRKTAPIRVMEELAVFGAALTAQRDAGRG